MIPRIFVSSTNEDLQHIRDAIRELIAELGYQPVMNEHGEIGYSPDLSAADACYREAKDCDFGILIVGKRYGKDHRDGVSVTHNEYRALRSEGIPVIVIVEKNVLSFRSVFSANIKSPPQMFPGMDRPEMTFRLLDEITQNATNNAISEFTHIGQARDYVRLQIAHLFGKLLRDKADPVKGEVKDILAEVRTLRNEITKSDERESALKFLRVSRALLEDRHKNFREFLKRVFGDPDESARTILQVKSFDELLTAAGWKLDVTDTKEAFEPPRSQIGEYLSSCRWTFDADMKAWFGSYAILKDKRAIVNEAALREFRAAFGRCRDAGLDPQWFIGV